MMTCTATISFRTLHTLDVRADGGTWELARWSHNRADLVADVRQLPDGTCYRIQTTRE